LCVCRGCRSHLNSLPPDHEAKLAAHLATRQLPLWGRTIVDEALLEPADDAPSPAFENEQPRKSPLWAWLRSVTKLSGSFGEFARSR
jgi:hypothetical protein